MSENLRFGVLGAGQITLGDIALLNPPESRIHHFIGAIQGTESLCVTPTQALAVQRVLDAIYESSRLGREVVLSQR